MLRKRRFRRNKVLEQSMQGGYINGQGMGIVSRMRYGICRMSFNGCECIAVYNAMVYLGKNPELSEIVLRLESYRIFFGIFGCNPHKIGKVLNKLGADFRKAGSADENGAYIISYWTGKKFLSSLHTVFCVKSDNCLKIYNRRNNSQEPHFCRCAEELTKGKKAISVYKLIKK